MQDKKQTLNDAVSFISIALEQVKDLMAENNEPSRNVDPDKFNAALASAFKAGYNQCKLDIEGQYFSIDIEEGGFRYYEQHCLSDIVDIDDLTVDSHDQSQSFLGSSEHERIITEFDRKDDQQEQV